MRLDLAVPGRILVSAAALASIGLGANGYAGRAVGDGRSAGSVQGAAELSDGRGAPRPADRDPSAEHVAGPSQATPPDSGTPIVDPVPTDMAPGPPSYLPVAGKQYDPLAPGPVVAQAQGYVTPLEPSGRSLCAPATHALVDRPPGQLNPVPLAVLRRASSDPDTNLDFYIGQKVTVSGLESVAPEACRPVSRRLIAAQRVEPVEMPPDASAGRARVQGAR